MTKISKNLKIKYVPVDELKNYEKNPRYWSDSAKEDLRKSISKYGLVDPILCNSAKGRENVILGGHFRIHIAKELGIKEIPVVYVNVSDPGKERELVLRLNKNTGDWDLELLKEWDIPLLEEVGFQALELQDIFDNNIDIENDDFNEEEELEKAKTTNIKLGDCFALGEHRLICGDSTDLDVVKRLMNGQKTSFVNTDTIYNIGLSYDKGVGNKSNYGGKANDKMSYEEYKDFIRKIVSNELAVSNKDCHFCHWTDEIWIGLFQDVFRELGITNRRVLIWLKNNQSPTPQVAWNKAIENIVYGTVGSPYLSKDYPKYNEIMNMEIGTGNQMQDQVVEMFNIWIAKRVAGIEMEHPTQKSPELYQKALKRCTKPGDIILDLAGGSGSQLIASHQLKRRAYLAEIDPVFCQLIINRFESYVNKKAKKLN